MFPVGARLTASRLTCIRSDQLIFENLSLDVSPGELWQVTGPNGAGKTSLLRLLAGLSPAAGGDLSWRGVPLPEGRAQLQEELAFLGHLPGVTGFLTVRENLAVARALMGKPSAMTLPDAMTRAGLQAKAEVPAARLSAGQRQRLALARFLLVDAPLWILDEPFTALDEAGRAFAESLFMDHVARGGMAVVSTHHPLRVPAAHLRQLALAGGTP